MYSRIGTPFFLKPGKYHYNSDTILPSVTSYVANSFTSVNKQDDARCLSGEDVVKSSKVQAIEGLPKSLRSYGGEGDLFILILLYL